MAPLLQKTLKMPFLKEILDLLYPPKCPFCGHLLEKGDLLCPECQSKLPWLSGAAAEQTVELTEGCVSVVEYDERVKKAIHGFKFHGKSARSEAFGLLIAQCVREQDLTAEMVTWPPLSKRRLRKRGYDQAQLLAEKVGKELGLPVARTLQKKHRPAQSGLDGEAQRRANVLGAYAAINTETFRGKRLLLIDDVVTTGSTLSECAKTLRSAGAEAVVCATLARAGK